MNNSLGTKSYTCPTVLTSDFWCRTVWLFWYIYSMLRRTNGDVEIIRTLRTNQKFLIMYQGFLFAFLLYFWLKGPHFYSNLKYDVCSCLSQPEGTQSNVLSVKTEFMRVYWGRAMKTDPRYLLVNLYQTILKVRLIKMIVTILSWEVHSCILF